jgi:hypothetical protein
VHVIRRFIAVDEAFIAVDEAFIAVDEALVMFQVCRACFRS